MTNITVSVFILTYNQEAFISQTIESILKQHTNFKYQLVIGEDCSTDNTRGICESYASLYADKIKLLPPEKKNIGLIANYLRTIKQCDGEYIAICDGDDYWIDDLKLQKQVDFLATNQDFSIVYTNYKRLFPDGSFKDAVMLNTKRETTFDDLIDNNFIPSVTVLFRNIQSNHKIPEWIINHPYGDWPTYLWTIKEEKKIYFLNDITAVYRVDIGVSSGIIKTNSRLLKVNLSILKNMLEDTYFADKKERIKNEIIKRKLALITSFNREHKYFKAFFLLLKGFGLKINKLKLVKHYFYSIYKSIS